MSSNNSKPKTEKVVETKAEEIKPEVKTDAPAVTEPEVKADDVKPEETKVDIEKAAAEATAKADVKPEVKTAIPAIHVEPQTEVKLELAKKTLAAEKEKEADKQRGIYSAMGKFTIIRN